LVKVKKKVNFSKVIITSILEQREYVDMRQLKQSLDASDGFFVGDTRMQVQPGSCKLCERKNVSTFNERKLGESKSYSNYRTAVPYI
jgi:hypothetical protein